MRSTSKLTRSIYTYSIFWEQCIKSIMFLLFIVPLLVAGAEILAADQKEDLKIFSVHSPGSTNQVCKDSIVYKKSISIYNMGNESMHRILASEDMSQLFQLGIHHHKGLETVKFLEGLKLPLLKSLKITSGKETSLQNNPHSNPHSNPLGNAKPASIQPHINVIMVLDQLEIDTKDVFEGITRLVESTNDLLIIPLHLFAAMHNIGPVSLKVTSIKFTDVTVGALEAARAKTGSSEKKNTSVKLIKFAASVFMGPSISKATESLINEIINWMREMFKDIRCVDLENKNFVEPEHLRRVIVTGITLMYIPKLSVICINDLVLYARIRNVVESLGYLSGREMFRHCMLYDIVKMHSTWNAECLELVSFEEIKKYVERKQLIPYQSYANFASWYDANKKETIAGELGYSKKEFARYYV